VAKGDRAYLTDFGLIRRSRVETDLTKTGQFMGTVDYVAPEQVRGDEVDGRADVYSLGCVLYECLTAHRPFERASEVATLYAHLEDSPPRPSGESPGVPPALDEVVAKAMAGRPEDRYSTAEELAGALRSHLSPASPARVGRRRSMVFRSMVAAALLAAGLLGFLLVRNSKEHTPPEAATAPPLNSIAEIDPATGRVLAHTKASSLGAVASNENPKLIVGEGSVWVLWEPAIFQINPGTSDVEGRVGLGAPTADAFAVGSRTVWIPAPGTNPWINRFDPSTGGSLLQWLPEEPIASFRRAYDPTADFARPHITFVFPVPVSVGGEVFREHVRVVVSRMPAFDIRLKGLEKSWDHWLFLGVAEGRDEVIALHNALYEGIVRPYLWTERPYLPGVGLGLFADERDASDVLDLRPKRLNRVRFDHGLREAETLDLDYVGRIDYVRISGLNEGLTHITQLTKLPLA
jgi:Protein kinase domain/2'-5' RNA ligase superfamily